MDVRICPEDITVFQRLYAEYPVAVDWMLKFGNPYEKLIAGIIKKANEGKAGVWSLSAGNTWRPGIDL